MSDFLTIAGMPRQELLRLIAATQKNVPIAEGRSPNRTTLSGRVIANLFFEDSTRTRCSFETAVHRLGGQVFNLTPSGSSISKGESLVDTARNIECMGVAAIVVRCAVSGGAKMVADGVKCPVINAGDGRHEHPTQAILDVSTLIEEFGSVEGRTVAIVGDILHSRVARSDIEAFQMMGLDVTLIGPPALIPPGIVEATGVKVSDDPEAMSEADVIYVLRMQHERMEPGQNYLPSLREYARVWGVNARRVRPGQVVMHPGPMNRGVEMLIDPSDIPNSLIHRQVTNGVSVRMAVLFDLLSAEELS